MTLYTSLAGLRMFKRPPVVPEAFSSQAKLALTLLATFQANSKLHRSGVTLSQKSHADCVVSLRVVSLITRNAAGSMYYVARAKLAKPWRNAENPWRKGLDEWRIYF